MLPRAGFRAMAWASGTGVTHEVVVWPPGASLDQVDWRVSLAEVVEPAPFSPLPGIDRLLLVLRGAAMDLRIDGEPVQLTAHEPVSFRGEQEAACIGLPHGPTLDLNVMTRRGRYSAELHVVPGGLVECSAGERVVVIDPVTLDAALLEPAESVAVQAGAAVVTVRGIEGGEPACALAEVCPECGGLDHHRASCAAGTPVSPAGG